MPHPGSSPRALVAAAAGVLVVLLSATARPEGLVLLKLERVQPVPVDTEMLDGVAGLQELAGGWLGQASGAVVARLQAAGVAVTVLDASPAGKRFVLVLGEGAVDDPAVRTLGSITALEPGVALLAARDDGLRPRLPRHLALAPVTLSPVSIVRPAFAVAGRARAIPRAQSAAALAADARIAQAVAAVSRDRISATIRALEGYGTRYATTANLVAAGNYLFDRFRELGLPVEYDDFTFTTSNYPATNIVATIPGRSSPRDIVILGAHYDSYSDQRPSIAPGADDNATGTAAVLEAARVLAATPLDFTVRLVAFSAEEWGLYGSRHYAQEARARGDRIIAVVNLDMVGYADQMPEDLDVTANASSEWLADRFARTAAAYTSLAVLKHVNASSRSSDHAPFWDQGYSAVECIEDEPLRNPFYHRVTDRFETLTPAFTELVTRGAVALVADLSQPVGALMPPTGLSAAAETFRTLFSRATRVVLQWSGTAGASGYNIYRASSSHGTYTRLNAAPLTATTFADGFVAAGTPVFYVVTAVDAQGRESNYSAEVTR